MSETSQPSPRRRRLRTLLAVALLGLLLLVCVPLILLETGALDGPVTRRVQGLIEGAVEGPAGIGAFEVRLFPPRFRLAELELGSVEKDGWRLEARSVEGRVRPGALLGGRIHVERLVIEDPDLEVVQGAAEAGNGEAASPTLPPVSIAALELRGGRVLWKDPARDLELALTGLRVGSANLWDGRHTRLSAEAGDLRLRRGDRELSGELDGTLRLEDRRLHLDDLSWSAAGPTLRDPGPLELALRGPLDLDTEGPRGSLRLSLRAPAAALARLVADPRWSPAETEGEVGFEGTLALDAQGPALRGTLNSGDLAWRGLALEIRQTRLEADMRRLVVPRGDLRILDGAVRVEARLDLDLPDLPLDLSLEARALDPRRLQELGFLDPDLPLPASRLSADLGLRLPLARPDRAEGQVALGLVPRTGPTGPGAPPAASGRLVARLAGGRAEITEGTLELAEGRLETCGGRVGLKEMDLCLRASLRPGATTPLARQIRGRLPAIQGLAWKGRIQLAGRVAGPWAGLGFEGSTEWQGLEWQGRPLSLAARGAADASSIRLRTVSLAGAPVQLSGGGTWSLAQPQQTRLDLSLERLDLTELSEALGRPGSVDGELHGDLKIRGTPEGPLLQARLASTAPRLLGRDLREARADFDLGPEGLDLHRFLLALEEGTLAEAGGRLPWRGKEGRLSLRLEDLALGDLVTASEVRGRLSLEAVVTGSLESPDLRDPATFRIEGLAAGPLEPQDLAGQVALTGGELLVQLSGADSFAAGTLRLGIEDPWPLEAGLELGPMVVRLWETGGAPGAVGEETPASTGDGEALFLAFAGARLDLAGPLSRPEALAGALRLQGVEMRSPERTVRSAEPVRLVLDQGRLRLEEISLAEGGARLWLEGDADLAALVRGEPPAWSLQARGDTRLEALPPLLPEARMAGRARLDLAVTGSGVQVEMQGLALLEDCTARWEGFPQVIRDLSVRLVHRGRGVQIQDLEAELGGGRITGSGQAELEGFLPSSWRLELQGKEVGLRVPEGLRSRSDFDLLAQGNGASGRITGEIRVSQARYSERIRVQQTLLAPVAPTGPGPESFLDKIRLDVRLTADNELWIDNNILRVEGRGDLQVRGTASRPWLVGTVESIRPGKLTFNEVEYLLEQAILEFLPSAPNDPELSLTGATTLADYDITIQVTGRSSAPRIDLYSSPDLPREEIVALLASGGAWQPGTDPNFSAWAVAEYLAGQTQPLERSLARRTGLDIVRIDPMMVEGEGEPTARITVGERISKRATVTYTSTTRDAQGSAAELRYQVNDQLQLRGVRHDDGSNLVEARYQTEFATGEKRRKKADEAPRHRVRLEGVAFEEVPSGLEEAALREALGLEPGSEVEALQWLRAQDRVRARLLREGRPLARMRCRPAFPDHPGAEAWSPVCRLQPGPRITMEIDGALKDKHTDRIRSAVDAAWEQIVTEDELGELAAGAARDWYRARGHYRAQAVASLEGGEDDLRLRLQIEPGPRVRVAELRLVGGGQVPEEKLREPLLAGGGGLLSRGPRLTPELLEEDKFRLEQTLYDHGYLEARVQEAEIAWPEPARAVVTWRIEEGPRFQLREATIAGQEAFPGERVRQVLGLELPAVVDPPALEAAARSLEAFYDARGWAEAVVRWDLERVEEEPATVAARFHIEEGPHLRIARVDVSGNHRVREALIQRELDLKPGDPFSREELLAGARRLRGLGLFRLVRVRGAPAAGPEERDVVVSVVERPGWELQTGVGLEDEEGLRLSLGVESPGVAGRNISAGFQAAWSSLETRGQFLAGTRRLAGTDLSLLGSLGLTEQERPGFTDERRSLSLRLSKPLAERESAWIRYSIEDVDLVDVDDPQEVLDIEEGIVAGASVGWQRDRRNDVIAPRSGLLLTGEVGLFAEALGSEFEFVRGLARAAWYEEWPEARLAYAASVRLGTAWPVGDFGRVPRSSWFFAGGAASMRGYARDELGPRDPITGDRGGGEAVFVVNQELKAPLTDRIEAVAFLDAGNVWRRYSDADPTDLKLSVGPGLEIHTPAGPLRFMLGWKLDREPDENPRRFHFTFGPAF